MKEGKGEKKEIKGLGNVIAVLQAGLKVACLFPNTYRVFKQSFIKCLGGRHNFPTFNLGKQWSFLHPKRHEFSCLKEFRGTAIKAFPALEQIALVCSALTRANRLCINIKMSE